MTTTERVASVVSGGIAVIGVRALALLVAVVTAPLLARYLGPDRYGQLTLILAVFTLVVAVSDIGLPLLASRDLPTLRPDHRDRWLGDFWALRCWTALAVGGIGVLTVVVLPLDTTLKVGLVAAMAVVPAALLNNAAIGLFNADFVPGRSVGAELAALGASLLAALLVVFVLDGGLIGGVAVFAVGHVVALLVMLPLVARTGLRGRAGGEWAPRQRLAWLAAPLALVPILGLVYSRSDVLVLSVRTSDAEVGVYGVVWQLLEAPLIVIGVATTLLIPLFSGASGLGERQVLHRRAVTVLGMAIVPTAVIIALFGRRIVGVIGGGEFLEPIAGARPEVAVALVMAAFALMTIGFVNGALMIARGLNVALIRHFAIAIGANLLLAIWLVGELSYVGAAAATLIAEGIAAAHSTWVVRRQIGPLGLADSLRWPAVAGASVAVAVALTSTLPPPVGLGAAVLSVAAVAIASPLRHELARLMASREAS